MNHLIAAGAGGASRAAIYERRTVPTDWFLLLFYTSSGARWGIFFFFFLLFFKNVGCRALVFVNKAVCKVTESMNNKAAEEPHMEECLELDVLLMGSRGHFCYTRVG